MIYKMKIGQWLFCTVMIVLMTACGSSSEELKEIPTLRIFVYAPENPIPTRATAPASAAEKALNSLQIWVFRSDRADNEEDVLVGYISPTVANMPTAEAPKEYMITVTDEFATAKPAVDVFVAANISGNTCGQTFNMNTSRSVLKAAALEGDYFGTDDGKLIVTVPVASEGAVGGLPMTGVKHHCALGGESPVFSVDNVTLQRTVSKIRFVASTINGNTLKITKIKLNKEMIPKKEFLFLGDDANPYHVENSGTNNYNAAEVTLYQPATPVAVMTASNPAEYLYAGQTDYEEQVNGWIDPEADGGAKLSNIGLYYLRESDKLLKGTISYTIGEGANIPEKTADFEMETAGEFSRNHSWVVYAYFTGGDNLKVQAVYVTDWVTKAAKDHGLYNW